MLTKPLRHAAAGVGHCPAVARVERNALYSGEGHSDAGE